MAGMHASKIHSWWIFYISLHGTEVYPAHLKGSQVTKGVAKGKFEILIPPQKTQKMGLA